MQFSADGTSGQNVAVINTPFTASPGNETATVQIAAMFTSSSSASIYEAIGLNSSSGFLTQIAYFNGGAYFVNGPNPADDFFLPVALDTWNIYTIQLDYVTQTASGYVNGTLIGTSSFFTPSTDLINTGFGINSIPGNDIGYFDDLSAPNSPVPEPSSFVLLGTGTLALVGAARRKLFSR